MLLMEYAAQATENEVGIAAYFDKAGRRRKLVSVRRNDRGLVEYVFDGLSSAMSRSQVIYSAVQMAFGPDIRIPIQGPRSWTLSSGWTACPVCGAKAPTGPRFFSDHYNGEHAMFPGVPRPGDWEALFHTPYRDPIAHL